jgi:formate-dependent nitrite reductase cytochrome c552 subunit
VHKSNSSAVRFVAGAGAVIMAAAITGIGLLAREKPHPAPAPTNSGAMHPGNQKTLFPINIRTVSGAPQVQSGLTNFHGQNVSVACSTCHSTTTPNRQLRSSAELDQFHQGLTFNHGTLNCLSCHNESNYDTLRLADGSDIEFQNVMQLCAQCHGPQARDYRNGSHGGMNGFWDLTKGPRTRNNCVNCHNPHAPQYPVVMPVFQPVPPKAATDKHNPASPSH